MKSISRFLCLCLALFIAPLGQSLSLDPPEAFPYDLSTQHLLMDGVSISDPPYAFDELPEPGDHLAPALARIVSEGKPREVVSASASILVTLGPEGFRAALAGLRHEKNYVRSMVAEALSMLGNASKDLAFLQKRAEYNRELVPIIARAMDSDISVVRTVLAYQVSRLGLPLEVIAPILLKAMNDPVAEVRRAALAGFPYPYIPQAIHLAPEPAQSTPRESLRLLFMRAVELACVEFVDDRSDGGYWIKRIADVANRHGLDLAAESHSAPTLRAAAGELLDVISCPWDAAEIDGMIAAADSIAEWERLVRCQLNEAQQLRVAALLHSGQPLLQGVALRTLQSQDLLFPVALDELCKSLSHWMYRHESGIGFELLKKHGLNCESATGELLGAIEAGNETDQITAIAAIRNLGLQSPQLISTVAAAIGSAGRGFKREAATWTAEVAPENPAVFDAIMDRRVTEEFDVSEELAKCVAAQKDYALPRLLSELDTLRHERGEADYYSNPAARQASSLCGALTRSGVGIAEVATLAAKAKSDNVRLVALKALAKVGTPHPEVVALIDKYLIRTDKATCEAAAGAIAALDLESPEVTDTLLEASKNRNCYCKDEVTSAILGRHLSKEQSQAFKEFLLGDIQRYYDEQRHPEGVVDDPWHGYGDDEPKPSSYCEALMAQGHASAAALVEVLGVYRELLTNEQLSLKKESPQQDLTWSNEERINDILNCLQFMGADMWPHAEALFELWMDERFSRSVVEAVVRSGMPIEYWGARVDAALESESLLENAAAVRLLSALGLAAAPMREKLIDRCWLREPFREDDVRRARGYTPYTLRMDAIRALGSIGAENDDTLDILVAMLEDPSFCSLAAQELEKIMISRFKKRLME